MKLHRPLFLVALLLAAWFVPAQAASIEAEGIAAIVDGNIQDARQKAIRDGLRQAALSASAKVSGNTRLDKSGNPHENLSVTPAATAREYTVLKAWEQDDIAHVLLRAEIQEFSCSGDSSGNQTECQKYRKKIAVSRFVVLNSHQVEDIADIWNGYPSELLRQLEQKGDVLPMSMPFSDLAGGREIRPESSATQRAVRNMASVNGSQFVIAGVIMDAGYGGNAIRPYAGWQGEEQGQRSEVVWPPWPNVAFGLKSTPNSRRFEVEVFLFDGLTGALISRHRHGAAASGKVQIGRDKAFASHGFNDTVFGHEIIRTLNTQADALATDIGRIPFMANIVRIEGNKLFLDAGGTSGLAPDDKLKVYTRGAASPISSLSTSAVLGIPEKPVTSTTLVQVQPLFSIGEIAGDAAKMGIQVGDLVRVEKTESR
ncbi:MAG: flagellar assembly protein T N-terminal domain-containing protein [Sulfuricellaceae bacterium]|nr:flagellar assembly protein T N-terminal domain-containing protein [Sulfuricellaceae bacterium]